MAPPSRIPRYLRRDSPGQPHHEHEIIDFRSDYIFHTHLTDLVEVDQQRHIAVATVQLDSVDQVCGVRRSGGNVRELENVIRQAVVLAPGPILRARDLELTCPPPSAPPFNKSLKATKARLIEEFERAYLEEALVACAGNISKAARQTGTDRRTFFALLKKYDLAPKRRAT